MDFFQAQDAARRHTGRLIGLFIVAVLSLLIITNLLVMATLGLLATQQESTASVAFDWQIFLLISVAVIAVVSLASLYKTASLRGGGARVAEMLKARLLVAGTRDLYEQRVLNVVEEMAIASSTPVPPVYLLEEDAINAFAAGFTASDAVIGVTRGAITRLTRDELQGVIAHEFSHILNGDMRLNIRLIGLLHGILVLGMMGYYLLRTAGMARRSKNGNGVVFLAIGLIIIGATGTFFGKLIKAAVSRQREYLADASAVQFTRNNEGIAGALKRIGASQSGSRLQNPAAAEVSHALFAEGVKTSFRALFATHPPLHQRIKRLQPDWDGEFGTESSADVIDQAAASNASEASGRDRSADLLGVAAGLALSRAGAPDHADIAEATRILRDLVPGFLDAAHEPHGARALVYYLLLLPASGSDGTQGRQAQLAYLEDNADAGVHTQLKTLIGLEEQLQPEHRLALVNIALSALRQLSPGQYELFRKNMDRVLALAAADRLLPWMYWRLVRHHLDRVFGDDSEQPSGRLRLSQCVEACAVLLSMLAHLGQQGVASATAFAAAQSRLGEGGKGLADISIIPADQLSLERLDQSVLKLGDLVPADKKQLLLAMAVCIQADDKMTPGEQELFRTVAEILDCPTPALF